MPAFDEWRRPLRPGQRPRAGQLNDLARAAAETDHASGVGEVGAARELGGYQLRDFAVPGHWARISGAGTGPYYPHVQVWLKNGTWEDLPSPPYVTGQAYRRWAREANGRTDVPVDAVVFLVPEAGTEGFSFTYGGAGGQTLLVPLQRIEVAPPASGCDSLDDCGDQCWPLFYWAKAATRTADGCLALECGACVFLMVEDGIPLPLGVPILGRRTVAPPAEILAAPLPLDFPCTPEELASAPMYAVRAEQRAFVAVPGDAAGWCVDPESGAYWQVYECELFANWIDCATLNSLGPAYMADVKGCSSTPGVPRLVHAHRLLRGDEFSEPGDPRACALLCVYDRPKHWEHHLERDGGDIVLMGPSADACGDEQVEIDRIAGCCGEGGGGGTGGEGCCPDHSWGTYVTASVPGAGFIILDAVLDTDYYLGSFVHPGCGLTQYLRYDRSTCTLQASCSPDGPWVSLVQPVGFTVTCGPETPNLAGPYDGLAPATSGGSGVAMGCPTNTCAAINNIFIGGEPGL